MKILVISDLHVGMKARALDFCTSTSGSTSPLVEDYISDLKDHVTKVGLEATHLVIAGDITETAEPSEFRLASERIKDVQETFGIEQKNTFFVPGNHDSNWSHEQEASENGKSETESREQKYTNIRESTFFNEILSNAAYSNYYQDPYASIWVNDEIIVLGINSSAYDKYSKEIKFGEVNLKCLETIEHNLNNIIPKDNKKRFRLLLTHHHPVQYTDRTFEEPDYSQMKNAEDFLKFASRNEFDFIVHGHKHIPRFDSKLHNEGHCVNILSSGSFSAQLKEWHNGVANFLHIIEHKDYCEENGYSRGEVKTWAYFKNHKWKKSISERDYISHKEHFGFIASKHKIIKILKSIINKVSKDKDHVRWSDILENEPNLMYCNRKLLHKCVSELANEMGIEMMPGKLDDFILWME